MTLAPRAKLGTYFESFLHKLRHRGPFDPNGIPLWSYGPPFGDRYFPVVIAQFALGCFERHLNEHRPGDAERFLSVARWFVDSAVDLPPGAAVWHHTIPLPKWNAWPPWVSGMAQGQAISVLLRAYEMTGDQAYADTAAKAYQSFHLPVREGGVACDLGDGRVFYEEVATEPGGHILNGMVFALWGLMEYGLVTGNRAATEDFDRGVETVATLLPDYDSGYWSRYSLLYPNQIASRFYHMLHIRQLRALHEASGHAAFLASADRWRAYASSPACRARQAFSYRYVRVKYLLSRWRSFVRQS